MDPISVVAGLVQTGLYADFFYVYFTKYVLPFDDVASSNQDGTGFFLGRNLNCLRK